MLSPPTTTAVSVWFRRYIRSTSYTLYGINEMWDVATKSSIVQSVCWTDMDIENLLCSPSDLYIEYLAYVGTVHVYT